VETMFELRITCSDIMINYQLSQKLKLIRNGEFNHLIIILALELLTGATPYSLVHFSLS
jgi:hypothetical protein